MKEETCLTWDDIAFAVKRVGRMQEVRREARDREIRVLNLALNHMAFRLSTYMNTEADRLYDQAMRRGEEIVRESDARAKTTSVLDRQEEVAAEVAVGGSD